MSPSKLNQSYTVEHEDASPTSRDRIPQPRFSRESPSASPTREAISPDRSPRVGARLTGMTAGSSDAASKLAPAQLREIREAFQVLDRDNDGSVNKDDVADVLVNVGMLSRTPSHNMDNEVGRHQAYCVEQVKTRLCYTTSSLREALKPSTSPHF